MLLAVHCSFADSWMPPTPQAVASPSAAHVARIEPAGRADQPNPPKCRALIYVFNASTHEYERTKELPLANDVAPVEALIRDDGRYLVTFDDYFSTGYGNNIIVIYDLVAGTDTHLKLEDFLQPAQIADFTESTSSRQWRGLVDFMHEQRYIYIGATDSPFDSAKKYPSFILDSDTKTVSIDRRMEQQAKQPTQKSPAKSWWKFWK